MSLVFLSVSIGGILPIYLLSLFFGWLLFKKLDEKKKIIYSVIVAYIAGVIVSGYGNMDGGSFDPFIFEYLVSSIILIGIRLGSNSLRKPKSTDDE